MLYSSHVQYEFRADMRRNAVAISSSFRSQLLVGRERDLGVLRDHLASAVSGTGGLVLIGGEAGMGKTMLAHAICHEAEERCRVSAR